MRGQDPAPGDKESQGKSEQRDAALATCVGSSGHAGRGSPGRERKQSANIRNGVSAATTDHSERRSAAYSGHASPGALVEVTG